MPYLNKIFSLIFYVTSLLALCVTSTLSNEPPQKYSVQVRPQLLEGDFYVNGIEKKVEKGKYFLFGNRVAKVEHNTAGAGKSNHLIRPCVSHAVGCIEGTHPAMRVWNQVSYDQMSRVKKKAAFLLEDPLQQPFHFIFLEMITWTAKGFRLVCCRLKRGRSESRCFTHNVTYHAFIFNSSSQK